MAIKEYRAFKEGYNEGLALLDANERKRQASEEMFDAITRFLHLHWHDPDYEMETHIEYMKTLIKRIEG